MKFNLVIFILLIVCIQSCSNVTLISQEEQRTQALKEFQYIDFYKCEVDADCMVAKAYCGYRAINQKFQNLWVRYSSISRGYYCGFETGMINTSEIAVCLSNKCTLRPKILRTDNSINS